MDAAYRALVPVIAETVRGGGGERRAAVSPEFSAHPSHLPAE